ncbi:MAG: RidA family protein [Terriglobia bacterium]
MRIYKLMLLCAVVGGFLALVGPARAEGQYKRGLSLTSGSHALPFSDGIVVGNTLYVAGEQGMESNGKLVAGGIGPQTKAALKTIEKVVRDAGFTMGDVVAVNVYLADVHDFSTMNEIYTTFFPNPKPTRTTVQVAALVNGAKIEISAIAVRRPSARRVPARSR